MYCAFVAPFFFLLVKRLDFPYPARGTLAWLFATWLE